MSDKTAITYGIGLWYGLPISSLSPIQKQQYAKYALGHADNIPHCPFKSLKGKEEKCHKKGGVCALSPYQRGEILSSFVTVCPSRFIDKLDEGEIIFSWISETILKSSDCAVLSEIPFLEGKTGKKAGRIDWVIMDKKTADNEDPNWLALEMQALYFSGTNMKKDFMHYLENPYESFSPPNRRPDYRSSGPKRLWPQLQLKVPLLRNWGKKVAVIIDDYFLSQMGELKDSYPAASTPEEKIDNAEIIWFVVNYDKNGQLRKGKIFYTSLDASRYALENAKPISKRLFNEKLRDLYKRRGWVIR